MLAMAEDAGVVLLEFLDRPALTAELEELNTRHGYAAAFPGWKQTLTRRVPAATRRSIHAASR